MLSGSLCIFVQCCIIVYVLLGFFVLTSVYVHSDIAPDVLALCFVLG